MDPGQEKDQQGDQPEAHSVELPADGSPMLEEHPDDGKDLGKVRSDVVPQMSDNIISGDYDEESRCSSPLQSVDGSTSFSGSSSQDDCTSSSSGSCISSHSGRSTPISSEDEVGSDYTSSYGSISTTSCSPTVDRPYAELELLEDLQRQQVGLVGNVARVTSVSGINRKRTRDSDSEEEPPSKRTRDSDSEEEPPSKRTRDSDSEEEPVFSPSLRMPCEGPITSVYAISPPVCEDPVLSSPVLSSPRRTECEDPILSSSVVSPSPSTYCKIPSSSFPCICVWMKSHMDREEEPSPSTSGMLSDLERKIREIRESVSSRQVRFRPHYDWSSDDSD